MTPSLRRDVALLSIALCAVLAWDASGLDLWATRFFGGSNGFPWREHWLTARLLHDGGRVAGWLALAAAMLRRNVSAPQRLWWLGTTLACAIAIQLLKHASTTSCPWALAEFGGIATYVPHWRWGVADGGSGQCFPSGHAASALALLPGVYVLRGVAARRWLLLVLGGAVLFGAAQLVRGAHYASHTLWTAWVCWALTAASHHAVSRARWRRQCAAADGVWRVPRQPAETSKVSS
jgi:membrane-associated PAP2 superfamily phosphatase